MVKLVLLLLVFGLLQYGLCSKRDQRHAVKKVGVNQKTLDSVIADLTSKDINNPQDKEEIITAASDFLSDGAECLKSYDKGIVNNTRNNKLGKEALTISQNGAGYLQIKQKVFQEDPLKLKVNLISALKDFVPFNVAIVDALPKAKESTENNELANNAMLDAIDDGVFLFSKLNAHIKNSRATNSQLVTTIDNVSSEATNALGQISSSQSNIEELVIIARQFKHRVHLLISRLQRSNPKQGELKTTFEQTIARLKKLESEIKNKIRSKQITLVALQGLYKGWLGEISTTASNLDKQAKGQSTGIVRAFIFEALGIAACYKTHFEILSG